VTHEEEVHIAPDLDALLEQAANSLPMIDLF